MDTNFSFHSNWWSKRFTEYFEICTFYKVLSLVQFYSVVVWTFQFYPNSSKLLWESRAIRTENGAGDDLPPDLVSYLP